MMDAATNPLRQSLGIFYLIEVFGGYVIVMRYAN